MSASDASIVCCDCRTALDALALTLRGNHRIAEAAQRMADLRLPGDAGGDFLDVPRHIADLDAEPAGLLGYVADECA